MMSRTIATAAATLVGAAVFAGNVASVHADPPKLETNLPDIELRRVAPVPLDAMKRVVRMNQALKLANLPNLVPTSPPQALEMRLTPAAPRLPNGAQILRAGLISFHGASAQSPDGRYMLASASSAITLRVPTEPNKLYVVDCRIEVDSPQIKVSIAKGAAVSPVAVEDGHAFQAFQASGASTEIRISLVTTLSASTYGFFYGCDVGKAN